MPPGCVVRTGDAGLTALLPGAGVPPIGRGDVIPPGAVGSVRAGVGSGATGADERSAGLGAFDAGDAGVGAGGVSVGRGGTAGMIGADIAGVGRDGAAGGIAGAITGVGRDGVVGIRGSAGAVVFVGAGLATGAAAKAGVRDPTGVADVDGVGAARTTEGVAPVDDGAANSSLPRSPDSIVMTAPQTEHRARTLDAGIRVGSTRKTERHSWQVTFMPGLLREQRSWVLRCV